MKKFQISQEGLDELKTELKTLKKQRKEITERVKIAKEQGDLKENAEYHIALEEMDKNDARTAELEEYIRNAEVFTKSSSNQFVGVGSKVTIKSSVFGEKTFQIVSSAEADPSLGKLSSESPLGSAFMHKSSGEEFEVQTPGGVSKYKILKIE
jgi:transcription elongation factor GreA